MQERSEEAGMFEFREDAIDDGTVLHIDGWSPAPPRWPQAFRSSTLARAAFVGALAVAATLRRSRDGPGRLLALALGVAGAAILLPRSRLFEARYDVPQLNEQVFGSNGQKPASPEA